MINKTKLKRKSEKRQQSPPKKDIARKSRSGDTQKSPQSKQKQTAPRTTQQEAIARNGKITVQGPVNEYRIQSLDDENETVTIREWPKLPPKNTTHARK